MEHPQLPSDIQKLAAKWVDGTITPEEKAYYETWYAAFDDSETEVEDQNIGSPEMLSERILTGIEGRLERDKAARRKIIRMRWVSIAASLLLIISAVVYFLTFKDNQNHGDQANLIFPGGNVATLHLANGRKIILTNTANGTLLKLENAPVTKSTGSISYASLKSLLSTDIKYDTLSIPRGGTYQLTLADGSHVWLNSSSAIRFPESFSGKERRVELLSGEAYFEVSHDAQRPFRVITRSQTVEVLGTHFNINSYADEQEIKTTLLEGSVKVLADQQFDVIKPGEQAALLNGMFNVSPANTEEAVAWKNGYFRFNGERIESIMRKLSRWYNIDVRYQGTPPDEAYTAALSRYRPIEEVLKELSYSNSVHFKIEGRRVTVMQ